MGIDIGLDRIRLPGPVSQELKVQLVTDCVGVRIHLPHNSKQRSENRASQKKKLTFIQHLKQKIEGVRPHAKLT